jgi:AcrR family transcriptional regulator
MDETKDQKRIDAQRNREAVVEAALALLAEEPGASMQEIADASGLGRSTVYRHFPNRDDLLAALQGMAVEHARIEAETVFARDDPLEPTLHALSEVMLETGTRYWFMLGTESAVSKELQVARRRPDSPIRNYFEACMDRGEIRDDLPIAWIMSAFQALSLAAMQDQRAGTRGAEEATRCLAASLVAMLRPLKGAAHGA